MNGTQETNSSSNSSAPIRLEGLRKVYPGGTEAVQSVDLDIQHGEFLVLVGPSGCGKSTLLRMIAGLESISGGTLSISGKESNHLHPKDRNIAMVFQDYALYPHMTVYENMAFGLRLRHQEKNGTWSDPLLEALSLGFYQPEVPGLDQAIQEAAQLLNIEQLLQRKPSQLSGGQRQRVAMGRAIVRNPVAFLFDEPLSNLDAKLRNEMRVELSKLHQRLKTTIIYVTHDQVEAMTLGQRIAVMNAGKIQQLDTPIQIYNHPANKFVATFIGNPSINLIRGTAKVSGSSCGLEINESKTLNIPSNERIRHQQELDLGIRPENCELYPESENLDPHSSLKAQISVIEELGENQIIIAQLEGHSQQITAKVHHGQKFSLGEKVQIKLNMDCSHLFDAHSEENLLLG